MKIKSIIYFIVISAISIQLPAATLTDNFDNGIDSNLWQVVHGDAVGAPWSVSAETGPLEISKSTDYDNRPNILAGINSQFKVQGNFSVWVDFDLIQFPAPSSMQPYDGWNWSCLRVTTSDSATSWNSGVWDPGAFSITRGTGIPYGQGVEGYSCVTDPPLNIGLTSDTTTQGKYGITRNGSILSAWIDRGYGPILLGSLSSPTQTGTVIVELFGAQVLNGGLGRPHTPLDIRFDNFTVTADSIIIPEPATLSLLAIGGLLLRRKKL